MNEMLAKLATLWPQIALGIGACLCLLFGLWPTAPMRRLSVWVAGAALLVAGFLTVTALGGSANGGLLWTMAGYLKLAFVGLGLLLLLTTAQLPDSLRQIRQADQAAAVPGRHVDPGLIYRGEFFAFFLLSIAGAMLTVEADDLVWLFLALELVSLPTYVMVAISRDQPQAQEAGVKYFFLGALAVAIFLYGFALIYGATGVTRFADIRLFVQQHAAGGLSPLLLTGLVLAIVGIGFKIAAVPMHFYTADVYQGAATPVTAFLAFVPKAAGFAALILLLSLADPTSSGHYPSVLTTLLGVLAALTMTVGNVLGLLQTSVKRVLAYSSIAHSGYMLVGLTAGVATLSYKTTTSLGDGLAGVLFYLVAYGLATIAALAVLGCLPSQSKPGEEADTFADLSGLAKREPWLAGVMLVAVLSLIGLPPLVGFLGKIYLFGAAVQQGYLWLVILAVLNSAVSAVYYLRIVAACFFDPTPAAAATLPVTVVPAPSVPARRLAAALAALGALGLGLFGGSLAGIARSASEHRIPLTSVSSALTLNTPAATDRSPSDQVTASK